IHGPLFRNTPPRPPPGRIISASGSASCRSEVSRDFTTTRDRREIATYVAPTKGVFTRDGEMSAIPGTTTLRPAPCSAGREVASCRGVAESAPWMAHVPDSGHGWSDGGAETTPWQDGAPVRSHEPTRFCRCCCCCHDRGRDRDFLFPARDVAITRTPRPTLAPPATPAGHPQSRNDPAAASRPAPAPASAAP